MNETYIINDLEGYAQSIRENAARSLSETYTENLDHFITIQQIYSLVEENLVGRDEEDNYIIDENSYNTTFDQIRTWLYNVGLARLASEGHIECAWDNDANEMVFWATNNKREYKASNNKAEKNTHETKPRRKSDKSSKRKNS
jgi:hypothetical protein